MYMITSGGKKMNYCKTKEAAAKNHSTDSKTVDAGMKSDIRAAGCEMDVAEFIAPARETVLKRIE